MSKSTLREIDLDLQDDYHRYLKYVLLLPMAIYMVIFVTSAHRVVVETAAIAKANVTGNSGTEQIIKVAVAKDALRMPINTDLPEWKLNLHAYAAMITLACCLYQKHTLAAMRESFTRNVFWHRWVGRLACVSVLLMDLGGFLMAEHSDFERFTVFIYFFAAPFFIFALGTYLTAKQGPLLRYHRVFANMLLKGCLGTPLARWGGALLQNYFAFDDSRGYYVGIFGVAAILGVWQLIELYQFLRETGPYATVSPDVGMGGIVKAE